jgi:membrane-associated protease RseP (regulator of RpoE activity)
MFSYQGSSLRSLSDILHFILSGVPFTLSLLSILLAHEFGHYLAGKHHKSNVTLPYFIPFPMSYFGTMGAFIQLKEPPKNRRVMLDISIAGPLAGLVVAIPILLLGLSLSPVERLPFHLPAGQIFEGNSILYLALKYIVHGEFLPNPGNYHGMTPFIYWVVYFFTGSPLPSGGFDVTLHPVAWAGWAGLLVTAINLIPAGQLDGGHLLYVLLGRRAPRLIPFVLAGLLILGFVWYGWWIWAVLILVFGTIYAEPLDLITPLDRKRKLIAILGIIIFLLVFTPVPLVQIMA